MKEYIIWAVAIVVFGILEGITAQLVSIWFVVGSIGALIAAICGAEFYLQVIIFAAVSVVALVITRPLVKKYIKPTVQSTNADRCIGKEAIVTETIDNLKGQGQAKVFGNEWSARSSDGSVISEGSVVTVKSIEGVKLIVIPEDVK